jgi:hypothetical protein
MAAGRDLPHDLTQFTIEQPTPLKATLDAMYGRWLALGEGERLELEWTVHPLPILSARDRAKR